MGPRTSGAGWRSAVVRAGVAGALYLLAYRYAVYLRDPDVLAAAFWPGAGVSVTALLVSRRSHWPVILAAVGAAQFASAVGAGLGAAVWTTLGNLLVAATAAGLARHWGAERLVGLGSVLRFAAAAGLGAMIGGLVGAPGIMAAGSPYPYPALAAQWLAGDTVGILTIVPAALAVADPEARSRLRRPDAVASLALACGAALALFTAGAVPLLYLMLPPLALAALRAGMPGAAVATFALGQVANHLHAAGHGILAALAPDGADVRWQLQLFLVTATVTTLALAAVFDDLRRRDAVEQDLRRQARRDALTGLPNRAALRELVDDALARADRRADAGVALLLCDLDDFKATNDELGHRAGDQVLQEIARRLEACVRTGDVVARLSGDEFVVLVEGAAHSDLDALTERLLAGTTTDVVVDGGARAAVSMSIGVAVAAAGQDGQALLDEADAAMYRAKRRGRGRAERLD